MAGASSSTSTTASQSNSISQIWHDYAAEFAKHGLSGGKLAASIVMPLLVAFFGIAAYVLFSRRRQARKRAAWKEETDKRMSMVSVDWQSMSAAGGAAAVRSSFQTNRTPRGSAHTRTQSALGLDAAGGGVAPSPLRAGFASEDISQLGPRARALSAAAGEGRPISSLVKEKDASLPGAARTRSQSTAALDAVTPIFAARARAQHGRTISASAAVAPPLPSTPSRASNNPFADAMAKRDSQGHSPARMAFPTFAGGPPTPTTDARRRADSDARPLDNNASRTRLGSRVSFADALDGRERGRTQSTLSRNRLGPGDDYALEMQDALPALARESLPFSRCRCFFRVLIPFFSFFSLSNAHPLA